MRAKQVQEDLIKKSASFVAKYALAAPVNGKIEIAGPQRFKMYEIVAQYLEHLQDPRKVVPDGKPVYFGGEVTHTALVPAGHAELGALNFEQWWGKQLQKA